MLPLQDLAKRGLTGPLQNPACDKEELGAKL